MKIIEGIKLNQAHKVALVTGATGGIGEAIAERLAKDGFAVSVHYSGNSQKASALVEKIVSHGGHATSVQADISDSASVKNMFDEVMQIKGSIDAVINSAGIMPMAKIEPDNIETFQKIVNTNLIGSYLVLSHAAQLVSNGGRIIAFSSSVVAKNFPGYGGYIASKLGVEGLVRVLANELKGRNIRVNSVAPGPTGTDLFYKGKTDEQIEWFKGQSPLGRIGTPEDIAEAVAVLVGPGGEWINGQILRVNGGFA